MSDEIPGRISVSRDALRADMAEMELRLQNFIRAELGAKADKSDVVALQAAVRELQLAREARDRGEFTVAQQLAIEAQVERSAAERTDRAWTRRDQALAVLSAMTAVAMLVLSVVLAQHGVIL